MAFVDTDVMITVFRSSFSTVVGQNSIYVSEEHPGSNKKIQGWQWDRRTWPTDREFQASATISTLWDPTTSGISDNLWQSGYGDNDDLAQATILPVYVSDWRAWVPRVHSGYFYNYEDEWYLFSDEYQSHDFLRDSTVSGLQFIDLQFDPKPTYPIQVRRFRYNKVENKHYADLDFRKRLELTTSDSPEFKVDATNFSPPRVWLNNDWTDEIGSVAGGTPTVTEVSGLELVGISSGDVEQQFHLVYSPVPEDTTVTVWSYSDADMLTEWTSISGLDEFTSSGQEVWIDNERGVLAFGDVSLVPPAGDRIVVHYWAGQSVFYEPNFAGEWINDSNADLNPLSALSKGFVQVQTAESEVASIVLTAELPTGSPYQINVGNNIGRLVATVKNSAGEALEGQTVTFDLQAPILGTFGTETSISSATGASGKAFALYSPPSTVEDIGTFTTDVVIDPGVSATVSVSGISEPTSVSGVWVYKVWQDDKILGIPEARLETYYTDYLNDNDLPVSGQADIDYEILFREMHGLGTPETYSVGDISTGKKTLVTVSGEDIIDPRTGTFTGVALGPRYSDSISNTGSDEDPVYSLVFTPDTALEEPGINLTKSYFVAVEGSTSARAYVVNQRSGRRIYSNTIDLNILITEEANGTKYVSAIDDVVSGVLARIRDIDDVIDTEILATQSDWYSSYLEERSGDMIASYLPYTSTSGEDIETIGLWHFDGNTNDSSGNGLNLINIDAVPTSSGLSQGAYDVQASGQCFQASGLMTAAENQGAEGTFEFNYKSNVLYVGDTDKTDMLLLYTWGNLSYSNTILFGFWKWTSTGDSYLRCVLQLSDDDIGWIGVKLDDLFSSRDELLDWHHYKLVWLFDEIDPAYYGASVSGILSYGIHIDGIEVASGVELTSGPAAIADGADSGIFAGYPTDSIGTPLGLYDEVRFSNGARLTNTTLTVSGYDFVGESYINWFRRTHKADSVTLGLDHIELTAAPGDIPLGFRLKSAGITVASEIDQVTYINPNEYLISGYYE